MPLWSLVGSSAFGRVGVVAGPPRFSCRIRTTAIVACAASAGLRARKREPGEVGLPQRLGDAGDRGVVAVGVLGAGIGFEPVQKRGAAMSGTSSRVGCVRPRFMSGGTST